LRKRYKIIEQRLAAAYVIKIAHSSKTLCEIRKLAFHGKNPLNFENVIAFFLIYSKKKETKISTQLSSNES